MCLLPVPPLRLRSALVGSFRCNKRYHKVYPLPKRIPWHHAVCLCRVNGVTVAFGHGYPVHRLYARGTPHVALPISRPRSTVDEQDVIADGPIRKPAFNSPATRPTACRESFAPPLCGRGGQQRLTTTLEAVKALLKADPSLAPPDRARIVASIRNHGRAVETKRRQTSRTASCCAERLRVVSTGRCASWITWPRPARCAA